MQLKFIRKEILREKSIRGYFDPRIIFQTRMSLSVRRETHSASIFLVPYSREVKMTWVASSLTVTIETRTSSFRLRGNNKEFTSLSNLICRDILIIDRIRFRQKNCTSHNVLRKLARSMRAIDNDAWSTSRSQSALACLLRAD